MQNLANPQRWVQIILLAALLSGCSSRPEAVTGVVPEQHALMGAAAGCNVLVLTLDTTRADRLGCYGWSRAATPNLDQLAARGVRFEQAFAPAGITLVSHTTLFSGTFPPEHGVRDNGRFAVPADLPLLAEIFQKRGYRTGGFVACRVLDSDYGIGRGFETYQDDMPRRPDGEAFHDRPGNMVVDDALAWLDRDSPAPFLCWIHLFDPHAPYAPPKEFLERTGDPYDGEVAFMDSQIGRVLDRLRARNLLEKTLILAVGDHGESLGDHGYDWHALLIYDSILRVPLIVSLPGRVDARVHPGTVRLVDVMPTMLDLMGWPVPAEVSGTSLIRALAGEPLPSQWVYAESDFPFINFGWSRLRSLANDEWKYIRSSRPELYDRRKDPGELIDQAASRPEQLQRMESELAAFEAKLRTRPSVRVELDADAIGSLRALGYTSVGVEPEIEDESRLKHPRDMIQVNWAFRRAESFFLMGRFAEAIELAEPAALASPESFVIVELLGMGYARAQRLDEAQHWLALAVQTGQANSDTYFVLAGVFGDRAALGRAVSAAEQALKLDPTHQKAKALLAALQRDLQSQQAELAQLRATLAQTPAARDERLRLALILSRNEDYPGAIRVLREGYALKPDDIDLSNALAWFLATAPVDAARDGAEAVRIMESTLPRADEALRPHLLHTYAAALAEAGRFDHAHRTLQQAAEAARAANADDLVARIERELPRLKAGQPLREAP